jgi:hypothetical protein
MRARRRSRGGTRDGGERLVRLALVRAAVARDGHAMLDALVLADQPRGGELLQRVALRRKLTQPILDVPEPALAR